MKKLSISLLCVAAVAGCIKNDLPYPVLVPHIISLEAEGALDVKLDMDDYTAVISLDEPTDIHNVVLSNVTLDEEMAKPSVQLNGTHDLSKPLEVTLTTYPEQDYLWTISCVQNIERYFTVKGQVGSTAIDEINHRAIVYVNKKAKVDNLEVTSLKLGPRDITEYSMPMDQMKDFTWGVFVDVTYHGNTERWELYAEVSESSVEITNINPWTREVYISASGVAGMENGIMYRELGKQTWNEVPESAITMDGGLFTAHITDLEPATVYECYAYCGTDTTPTAEFTTDEARQMPNNSFESVSLVTGESYYKWYDPLSLDPECQTMFWGSGNGEGPDGTNGTASLGIILTYPDSEDVADGRLSVRCESKGLFGLLACGNIFTGRFTKIVGTTGGEVYYGRPWTTRPRALRLYMKYVSGKIDLIDKFPADDPVKIGDNDRCQIAVSIGDWDYKKFGGDATSPVRVNTADQVYYNSKSEGIIAFGDLILGESTDGWIQVDIPLEYRSLTRRPTHLIITCAASYLGDYLTGSSHTTLWVDKMEMVY